MQTTLNIILVLCFLWCYNDKTATENPFGYDLDMSSSGFFTALKTSCAPQLCCSWEKRKHESVCKVTALKRVTDGTRAMPAWSLTSQLTPLAGSRPVLVLKTSNLWSQQFQTLTFLCQTVLQGLKSDGRGHFLGCCIDPEWGTLGHRIPQPGHPKGAHRQFPLSAMMTPPAWPCLYLTEQQQEIIL